MNRSHQALVVDTLAKMGQAAPSDIIQSMLVRDCRFAGFKFRYDGGYAVLLVGGNTIDLYDDEDHLLKTEAIGTESIAA